MEKLQHPTKEQVREFMKHRQEEHNPPPDIKEIRRQLGWDLLEAQRRSRQK
jgi:hypothetical protein